jgi:uncharacterized membrane protein YhaH (DUF805 family)
MGLISLLFSFEGRINRAKYWLSALIVLIGWMALFIRLIDTIADVLLRINPASVTTLFPIFFFAIAFPLLAVFLWSYAATTIKRLRDRNRSGWWIIPFSVLPILLPGVAGWLGQSYLALFLETVAFVLSIWSFIETFCLRGTRGPNRFGPDPLAPDHSSLPAISHGLA